MSKLSKSNLVSVSMDDLSSLMMEIIDSGGEVIITVTGYSMYPLLRHRIDRVLLGKADNENLHKGDIPLYVRNDGKYILHRIVNVRNGSYICRGDNQSVKEYGVRPFQVKAIVKGIWRKNRYVQLDSLSYRFYKQLWSLLFPIRWLALKTRAVVGKIYKKLFNFKRSD